MERENLEESEEMIVVAGGDHAEDEDDARRRRDVEAELPTEEVGEGAEDESSQDEADHGEGVEVRHHHGLQCYEILISNILLFWSRAQLFGLVQVLFVL